MALSEAVLRQVAAGRRPATLRIFRPGPTVAFGRLDAHLPGFDAACRAARDAGFEPMVRSAGGHAAAYDQGSVLVEHVTPEENAITGIAPRFEAQSEVLAAVLAELGADARVGELPGEYCAGAHSINLAGRHKVVGIAQRTVKNAALTSAVIVVSGSGTLRRAIERVYAALGIPVDPATVGAVEDTVPGVTADTVRRAVEDAYGATSRLEPRGIDAELEREARSLVARHRV